MAFMAPEQARDEPERSGASSDLFALGGVLYFLLTGQAPFGARTRDEQWRRTIQCDFDRSALRAKRVPRRLERIVLKAMAAEPEGRFASAETMAVALDAFARRPRRLAVSAAALALGALVCGGWSLGWRPARQPVPGPPIDVREVNPGATSPRPAALSLQIDSFQVALHARVKGDPVGLVGTDAFAARLSQDARIQVRFNMPAHGFLIALNPDGLTQLCYPESPEIAPPAATTIDYPPDSRLGYGLTDGVGAQVFVLAASSKPLPPYAAWSRTLGPLPWKPCATEGFWRYDGRNFETETRRGEVRRLVGLPPLLESTCRALQHGPDIEAIQALAFPVEPQPEPRKRP
jgi:hypothetical protein